MNKKIFQCEECSKIFNQKYNLNKHLNKKRCKGIEYSKMGDILKILKSENKYLKNKNIFLEKKINNLELRLTKLEKMTIMNNNITNKGNNNKIEFKPVTNNNITNNNITKNTTNNFYILPFGKEKFRQVPFGELYNSFDKNEIFKLCMYYKHFDLPQNRNIYMKTLNDCYVKDKSRWRKQKNCDKFINELFLPQMKEYLNKINLNNKKESVTLSELNEIKKEFKDLIGEINEAKNIQAKEYLYSNKDLVEEAKEKEKNN